jgi:small-conductance mechanosensitive channel
MKLKDLLKDAYQEGMSVEDITKALEEIELPADNSEEIDRLRNALSKSNSEAADYKKQLRERLSAEELKAKEDAEKWEQIEKERDALLREKTVSTNKAKLLALGYEEALADDTAEAMANGELDKVFANQKKHLDNVEKKIRSEILKDTPKPDGGSSSETMTKEKLRGMSAQERYKYSVEHPEEYKQIYGGNE